MRFQSFINEGRGRNYYYRVEDDVRYIRGELSRSCKQAVKDYKNGYVLYRGVHINSEMYVIDPKSGNRRSANTLNYYTTIIDNDKKWSKYPKRSQSIICTTNEYKSESYGRMYVVFPYDNPYLGVCPYDDMWDSFSDTKTYLGEWTREIDAEFKRIGWYGIEDDYESIVNALEELSFDYEKERDRMIEEDDDEPDYDHDNVIFNAWDKKTWFKDFVLNIFDPKNAGFDLVRNIKSIGKNKRKEVWTDQKSILIEGDIVDDVIDGL